MKLGPPEECDSQYQDNVSIFSALDAIKDNNVTPYFDRIDYVARKKAFDKLFNAIRTFDTLIVNHLVILIAIILNMRNHDDDAKNRLLRAFYSIENYKAENFKQQFIAEAENISSLKADEERVTIQLNDKSSFYVKYRRMGMLFMLFDLLMTLSHIEFSELLARLAEEEVSEANIDSITSTVAKKLRRTIAVTYEENNVKIYLEFIKYCKYESPERALDVWDHNDIFRYWKFMSKELGKSKKFSTAIDHIVKIVDHKEASTRPSAARFDETFDYANANNKGDYDYSDCTDDSTPDDKIDAAIAETPLGELLSMASDGGGHGNNEAKYIEPLLVACAHNINFLPKTDIAEILPYCKYFTVIPALQRSTFQLVAFKPVQSYIQKAMGSHQTSTLKKLIDESFSRAITFSEQIEVLHNIKNKLDDARIASIDFLRREKYLDIDYEGSLDKPLQSPINRKGFKKSDIDNFQDGRTAFLEIHNRCISSANEIISLIDRIFKWGEVYCKDTKAYQSDQDEFRLHFYALYIPNAREVQDNDS